MEKVSLTEWEFEKLLLDTADLSHEEESAFLKSKLETNDPDYCKRDEQVTIIDESVVAILNHDEQCIELFEVGQ